MAHALVVILMQRFTEGFYSRCGKSSTSSFSHYFVSLQHVLCICFVHGKWSQFLISHMSWLKGVSVLQFVIFTSQLLRLFVKCWANMTEAVHWVDIYSCSATFAKNDYLFRGMYFIIYLQRGPETNTYQWIYILPTFGVRISARISKVETNRSHRWTLALFMRPDAASSSLDGRHNNSTALLSKLCRISKENWLEMVPFFTLPVAKRWFQR